MRKIEFPIGSGNYIVFPNEYVGVNQETISTTGTYSFGMIFPSIVLEEGLPDWVIDVNPGAGSHGEDIITADIDKALGLSMNPGDCGIRGKIINSLTGESIPYAIVRWWNTSTETITSSYGYFRLVIDPESGYTGRLEIDAPGCEHKEVNIAVSPDADIVQDITVTGVALAPEDGPTAQIRLQSNLGAAWVNVWRASQCLYEHIDHDGSMYYTLPIGLNYISIGQTGYGTTFTAVNVPAGKTSHEMINLPGTETTITEAAPPPCTGIVNVTSNIAGAMGVEGFLGGGLIVPFSVTQPIGTWRIFLDKEGYTFEPTDVEIKHNESVNAYVSGTAQPEGEAGYTVFEEKSPSSDWHPDARTVWDRISWAWSATPIKATGEAAIAVYRTFLGKDPYTQEEITPDARDYITTGALIVGSGLAAGAVISGLAAEAGTATVITEMVNAGTLSGAVSGTSPIPGTLGALSAELAVATPSAAGPVLLATAGSAGLGGIWKIFFPIMFVQQLDVAGWGFGWMPEPIHRKLDNIAKQINGGLIRLDRLIRTGEWESAGMVVGTIRNNIKLFRDAVNGAGAVFWSKFGLDLSDVIAIVDGFETDLEAIIRAYPAIEAMSFDFPDDYQGTVTEVVDGDTIMIDNTYRIRFVGIDTHEIGTTAGDIEKDVLHDKILGKTVTIKTDSHNLVDKYGRVLGAVFLSDENINLYMLRKFGAPILTETKYHKRHKYVDWDENIIVSKERELPVPVPPPEDKAEDIGTLKVSSSPSNAKIYLEGSDTELRTSETIKNLPMGDYDIALQLDGYDTMYFTTTVERARTTEVFKKLVKSAAAPKPAKPSRTTIENHFKNGIMDYDESILALAALGYDSTAINNYINEWILEFNLSQIANIYKKNIEPVGRVESYLKIIGFADADIAGLFTQWDVEAAAEAEQASKGNLRVTSNPKYANVYLDGVYMNAVTPTLLRLLEPKTYTVKVVLHGYDDKEEDVQVVAGQEATIHLDLEPVS